MGKDIILLRAKLLYEIFPLLIVMLIFTLSSVYSQGKGLYDLVIINGRVIDPETEFDNEGYNVGIRKNKIVTITKEKIDGKIKIDATGKIVCPGFVDILSYDPNNYGVWYKIADGVTTNLAMHGGTVSPKEWYSKYEKMTLPLNFGAGFFYRQARLKLGINDYSAASEKQINHISTMAETALTDGALGIGMSLEYSPGISTKEIDAMMLVAKRFNVPVFFHVRYSDMTPPGTNIEALNEVITSARKIGTAIHIDHINSTGGTFSMSESIKIIDTARNEGIDISACVYPYNFWATYLNSARFDHGWQERFKISYNDLQLAGSQKRLTETSFKKYRKLGKVVVAYAIPEEDVVTALKSSFVMIGSDCILSPGNNNHPRGAGAFSRTIARYVREKKILTLMEAIKKMTLLPAKRLESVTPKLKNKGRLKHGTDADIVIFDFERIKDKATVEKPNQFSTGIDYVIVNGKIVKDKTGVKKGVSAGESIRRGQN